MKLRQIINNKFSIVLFLAMFILALLPVAAAQGKIFLLLDATAMMKSMLSLFSKQFYLSYAPLESNPRREEAGFPNISKFL